MNPGNLSADTHTADDVIRLLNLAPLPDEGGFFRRTGEANLILPAGRGRAWSAIYFLVTPEGFPALHRLAADEIWCFHAGDPLEQLRLQPDGRGEWVKLGLSLAACERPQDVAPAKVWQGTRLVPGGRWALVSTVMAPEFRVHEFELGYREVLAASFPEFADGIRALTRVLPVA